MENRVQTIYDANASGSVLYLMSRDQRIDDNWSLNHSIFLSKKYNSPLYIGFKLRKTYSNATFRAYDFMIKGLQEVEKRCRELNIYFSIFIGNELNDFIIKHQIKHIVTDFSALQSGRGYSEKLLEFCKKNEISLDMVDAHNIVPVWVVSEKQEFAARTIRPKIHRLLQTHLNLFPILEPFTKINFQPVDWSSGYKYIKPSLIDQTLDWIEPGQRAAMKQLDYFIGNILPNYSAKRNDPNGNSLSGLSPYLHFGHISAQRVVLEVLKHKETHPESVDTFLEEIIVRRELSDNYCFYNKNYADFQGFPEWGKKTLDLHRKDKREYVYTTDQFEKAETHDELWNAAQLEMVNKGKMHGYMRMYWCKKILEWSSTPEEAQRIAIYLNDKYELDGRDPNGYVGIAWSVGGLHDRPWKERSVFGMVRYMNRNGCERKFDVQEYIDSQKPSLGLVVGVEPTT